MPLTRQIWSLPASEAHIRNSEPPWSAPFWMVNSSAGDGELRFRDLDIMADAHGVVFVRFPPALRLGAGRV
jgi:hypothetical protein